MLHDRTAIEFQSKIKAVEQNESRYRIWAIISSRISYHFWTLRNFFWKKKKRRKCFRVRKTAKALPLRFPRKHSAPRSAALHFDSWEEKEDFWEFTRKLSLIEDTSDDFQGAGWWDLHGEEDSSSSLGYPPAKVSFLPAAETNQ